MVETMIRVKPYKGRRCPRHIANQIRYALESYDTAPDRTELHNEAREFIEEMKRRKGISQAHPQRV